MTSGNLQPPPLVRPGVSHRNGDGRRRRWEYLATHVAELRAENRRTVLFVSTGDMIGAARCSRHCSTMNRRSFNRNWTHAVGNHEFDEGIQELLRMQRALSPIDGCLDGDGFTGARFRYLAANVINDQTADRCFRPSGFVILPA